MKARNLFLCSLLILLPLSLLAKMNYKSVTNEDLPIVVDGAIFENATQFNIYPESAIGTGWQAGAPPIWVNRFGITNGTLDGDYFENVKLSGGTAPDIYMLVEQVLNPTKVYEIYFFFISPTQQYWAIKAKLASATEYMVLHRDTEGIIQTPDKDNQLDRLYRVSLGTVTGSTDFRVDISSDLPSNVVRSVFDGVAYKEVDSQSGLISAKLNKELVSYPNPATDYLNFKLPNGSTQISPIKVYSANGQLHTCSFNVINNNVRLDINHLPAGYYYAKVSTSDGVLTTRFSKM